MVQFSFYSIHPPLGVLVTFAHSLCKNFMEIPRRNICGKAKIQEIDWMIKMHRQTASQNFHLFKMSEDIVCDIYSIIIRILIFEQGNSTTITKKILLIDNSFVLHFKKCLEKILLHPYQKNRSKSIYHNA